LSALRHASESGSELSCRVTQQERTVICPTGLPPGIHGCRAQKLFDEEAPEIREIAEPIQQIYPTGKSLLFFRNASQARKSKIFRLTRRANHL
jgi:hypothetical protein